MPPARPGVATARQEQWPPEHQDGSEDDRPPGKGGRDTRSSPRKKLSCSKVTPQILRRRHVVSALMSGVPLPAVQKQVGHKRLSTAEITVPPALVKEAYKMRGFGPEGRQG